MGSSDAARIRAAGVPITIGDSEHLLRYSLSSLAILEDKFGSLDQAVESLFVTTKNGDRPVLKVLLEILAAGLEHDGVDTRHIGRLLEPQDIQRCIDAMFAAIEQALPEPEKADDASPQTPPLHGGTSTTSAPSGSAAQMASSGA